MKPQKLYSICALVAMLAAPACARAQTLTRIEESEFGKAADGATVKQFTLRNAQGMTVKVMSYGASITEVDVPDRNGAVTNVVLGVKTFDQIQRFQTAAATIGRVANRIAGARFTLDGVEYKLEANNGANTLHGGNSSFSSKVWQG